MAGHLPTQAPPRRALDPVNRAVTGVLRAVAATGMFLMMAITFADVVGRYFMRPIFGASEMIQFLLALTIFAALGLVSAAGAHIVVDIFTARLRRLLGRPYHLALRLASLTGLALVAWQLGRLAVAAGRTGRLTIVLEWPLAWVVGPAALLAAAAVWIELAGHREPADGHADEVGR